MTLTDEHLSALISDAKFQAVEARFSKFCPFEALGMVRAEIRHSNFLGYVLDPFRPHGFGSALLNTFLERALGREATQVLDAAALTGAEVRREWRNIDLLVLLPKVQRIIVIELKIDASQSADQLERYRNTVQSTWPASLGWRHTFLFMTKNDEAPNDSLWVEFKLRDLVDAFGGVAAAEEHRDAPALDTLISYTSMMRKHHLGDKDLEERANELWSKHGEALSFLMERRPDPFRAVFERIRDAGASFVTDIAPPGVSVLPDRHGKSILRYAFAAWDELTAFHTAREWTKTNRLLLLEIKLEDSGIRAYLMMGPGETPDRDAYAAALLPAARGRYLRVAEEELLAINPEGEAAYEDLVGRMAAFTQRVFDQFDPIMRNVSAQREALG